MIVNFDTDSLSIESQKRINTISPDRVAVIVLAGGEGKRLAPLTTSRCKPAVSFGGRYSLIDIPLSHSLTSGLKNIFVIGQYRAYTLQKHLQQTYFHHGITQNHIQMLVPEEREGGMVSYNGTADAIRKNLEYFENVDADYFLILSGDQLYNIHFQEMLNFAADTDAGMVIAAQPIKEKDASRMGLLKLDDTQLIDFAEKPKEQHILEKFRHEGKNFLGSMGIYLFKRNTLFNLLKEDSREDFGHHLITTQMKKGDVHGYLYDGYWEDIGTIESYYNANLALTRKGDDTVAGLQCYDERYLILTKPYGLPGAKVSGTKVKDTILCEGCIIEAETLTHSIIGVRSMIGRGTVIADSIIMGNEFYSSDKNHPHIGKNCLIEKAIIDENVTIGDNVRLTNSRNHITYDPKGDEPQIFVRDGILIVPRGAHIPAGYTF